MIITLFLLLRLLLSGLEVSSVRSGKFPDAGFQLMVFIKAGAEQTPSELPESILAVVGRDSVYCLPVDHVNNLKCLHAFSFSCKTAVCHLYSEYV